MSTTVTVLGFSVLALLLAGYLGQQYLPPPKPRIVGIDLGTTYSCLGVYHAVTGDVEVVSDTDGHQTIPSMVAFTDDERVLVGRKALCQAEENSESTIYDAKRFIGKMFTDEGLQKEAARYPFTVKNISNRIEFILPSSHHVSHALTPEYIGSRILNHLKETGESYLGVPITKAVMSVPAEFDEKQRNCTKQAAALAGIEVVRIINEPTAAAMAYGLHKQEGVSDIIVIDMGGGTLDVSLLNVQGGMFQTMAMAGNNHLGGQDLNQRLMLYLKDLVERKLGKPLTNAEDLQHLRLVVEDVKLNLTSHDSILLNVSFPSLGNSFIFQDRLTRNTFEKINDDLFQKVLEPVKIVLEDIEMQPNDIDEIVLVGGSTRIPRVRQVVRDFFKKEPNVAIDPELAVAYGVAVQAGVIGGMWPLQVSAIELTNRKLRKVHVE
ncbi:heat shock 70 kDa protein 13-like [Amphiura filiformis]|uniref:heat shock 70 kDa protein 13-like n=1 Tax=Amphiura filiformis TaxID=82378 RepID=UPI003B21ABB7